MSHTQLAALAVAATALAAAGCGESSKTGSTAPTPTASVASTAAATTATVATTPVTTTPSKHLTHAETVLIARAGAICKRIHTRRATLKLNTQQAVVGEIPPFASYERAALAELHGLTPPASIAHSWKRFTRATDTLAGDTMGPAEHVRSVTARKRILLKIGTDEEQVVLLAKHIAITECENAF